MKKGMRLIAWILLSVMAAGAVVGCSGKTTDEQETKTNISGSDISPTEGETEEKESTEIDLLPSAVDYDGYTFQFLTVEYFWQEYDQMVFEELTGEIVKDAIYNRNDAVGDVLNISFAERYSSDVVNLVRNSVAAGDHAYDAVLSPVSSANPMYNENSVIALDSVIDLEAPWWYGNFNRFVNINNQNSTFAGFGRLDMSYIGCFMVMGINTDMIAIYQLENPYTVYRDGRWTLDYMYDQIQAVATDKDGDGQVTNYLKDVIGSVGANNQFSLMCSCGAEALEIKQEGTYLLNITERFVDIYDRVRKIILDPASCWFPIPGQDGEYYWTIFNEGRALYMSNAIAAFRSARDGETPYALLPYPKADDTQSGYYTVISNYVAGVSVPNGMNEEELARTGMVLDYLGAYSEPVVDAFVEATLYYKYARDEESIYVFRSMIDNVPYYDLAFLYDWGNARTKIDTSIQYGIPIASLIKSVQKQFEADALKTMNAGTD